MTATSPPRDTRRSAVYDAEDVVGRVLERGGTIEHYGSTLVLPGLRRFGDVADVPAYLDRVLAFAPVAALPRAGIPVAVRERRGARAAHYEPAGEAGPTIAVPPYRAGGAWALTETTVLHELAHHLCPDRPPHGPAFLAHLLHLYEHVIGPEAAHLLRVALAERGVTTGAPL
ncbi:hypothetical protein I601_1443 [Nocardioides dokdonensis FR1436]|uniref:TIGR04338 family metallohydrolase n=1 Tax=Nocardioides dokdonensis FR1436 TaxID=1300347 RepID=A0A1A9GHS2_9ACTN|nr:TIGR04338 family metallohydrolase [Nocardioides dokdonensis]ANH37879.1 hypothetical protein I601_1443 [Nocardioides dokdonensis FR1436]